MPESLGAHLTALGVPWQARVRMSEHTTLKVGGPAEYWVQTLSIIEMANARAAADAAGVSCTIVGHGSNLLVRDGGIDGVVLALGAGWDAIEVEGTCLHAQAGARLSQVAIAAQQAGLSGMEPISGIPGTVGGAVCMNAGSYGTEIAQLVRQVQALDADGQPRTLSRDEMAFGYRSSVLQQQGLLATRVTLSLAPGDPAAIAESMRSYAARRREKQPLSYPSAGSFFKRPPGQFAGSLIEAAGLKGLTVGGAQVSALHAGFLINTGGATAQDFLDLMADVQARVLEHSGIMLEPEVRILGCNLSC